MEWGFEAKAGSSLTNEDILNRNTAQPSFTPDVDGVYVIQLIVSDGKLESAPDYAEIHATTPNSPPNADAGKD